MPSKERERVIVEGHELSLTNLGKVMYPETGTTKAEVLEYYAAVAQFLIPAASNRPATRKRWVNGVGTSEHPGEVFFQKNLDASTPSWVPRVTIQHTERSNDYPLVNNLATLTWLAQMGSLEIHVPQWQVDASGKMLPPDRFVLDLDPGPGAGLPECVEVAKLARQIMKDMGLEPVPVTSGSKGIHLYAALDGTQEWEKVSAFAHELARSLESDHPELVVSDMKKTLRHGKVLVDWSQNSGNKTTIVPYSLRGRPHPMVAAPRTWRELLSPKLDHLDFTTVLKRVKEGKDPFSALTTERRAGGPGHLPSDGESDDDGASGPQYHPRLRKYVGMRDAARTPEPFPAPVPPTAPAASAGDAQPKPSDAQPKPGDAPPPGGIFVIQEHHARRYHLDLRLEHDGVLASWALPRGVPETPARNNLAVQTEDHPMEYATFAGIIPKGEYGAGTMSIWDSGTFECEKWREGKEVIATLTGQPGGGLHGTKRLALIHTGSEPKQWLIHLMKEQPGQHNAPMPHRRTPGRATGRTAETSGTEEQAAKTPAAGGPPASGGLEAPNVTPMLASAGTARDAREGEWLYELKWDGIRAIVTRTSGRLRFTSRNGNDITATYPELSDPAGWPEHDFVADGEIVAFDHLGRPSFGRLQQRMNLLKPADIQRVRQSVPVQLMLFDLVFDAGSSAAPPDLRDSPLRDRRARLDEFMTRLPPSDSPLHLSPVLEHNLDHILDSAAELGLEGVMAKRPDSRYISGRRTRSWIKIKLERVQEVVVGGWRPGLGARRSGLGALLVGIPDGDKLRYVGRVGTGFNDRQLRDVLRLLEEHEQPGSPFHGMPKEDAAGARWVEPVLVGEVRYSDWTVTERLRHPVWRGWRPDKDPGDVIQE